MKVAVILAILRLVMAHYLKVEVYYRLLVVIITQSAKDISEVNLMTKRLT